MVGEQSGRRTLNRPPGEPGADSEHTGVSGTLVNDGPGRHALQILLAEDDPAISDPLARALRREGYEVEVTGAGEPALAILSGGSFDLVVLDLGLPDVDGLEVCRRLRVDGNRVPVLVLTARADEVDTVVGLDAGADDYVTKPFRLAELLARVRALLRRGKPEGWSDGSAEEGAGVRIDAESRRAWLSGEELHLTAKEFDLLRVLVRETGRVVTRDQLMREVWETTWWSSTKTLDMHISWLRRKLGDDASDPKFITTVRGVGFRFERG
ncbi:DNA-binding response regulator, OmpR family, contains REC and winged-helix (wHTH) domain [Actinopolymorpha cephalotaxi]|uniref:DNA-binding response regulator, OmpR family, contains REC and winged-helix (WHTH) domain n=1 Tax=Actinopolymorpha cephalotaxi TaxID=504797 RepID=A0A1I2KP50_9ACTN|nr:DNA-binding response regulator, OmpR family, contains REC and winged-helix (wHTH) domain [Actinopolymorpha cephalotaxi]